MVVYNGHVLEFSRWSGQFRTVPCILLGAGGDLDSVPTLYLFIYLGFYVAFNTVQVISRRVVGRGRGNQYIEFAKVLYCKLPTNGKQLPAFPTL